MISKQHESARTMEQIIGPFDRLDQRESFFFHRRPPACRAGERAAQNNQRFVVLIFKRLRHVFHRDLSNYRAPKPLRGIREHTELLSQVRVC